MNKSIDKTFPLAYFITFTCYGTWLHGGKDKSVDRYHNKLNEAYVRPALSRENAAKSRMSESPFVLNNEQRLIVLNTIKHVCNYRCWELLAAHVRTNHVHFVVRANSSPEKVMDDIKAYASGNLNKMSHEKRDKYWTRHGSTRYLWETENIYMAIRYVVLDQGNQMAVYKNEKYSLDISECI